jgi:hypothetical protein
MGASRTDQDDRRDCNRISDKDFKDACAADIFPHDEQQISMLRAFPMQTAARAKHQLIARTCNAMPPFGSSELGPK